VTAQIISLAERRQSKGARSRLRGPDDVNAYVSAALRRVATQLGIDYSDIDARPVRREEGRDSGVVERCKRIAENLGIDLYGPLPKEAEGASDRLLLSPEN